MQITYATAHKWYKELHGNPQEGLSESLRSRLQQFLQSPLLQETSFVIAPLCTDFFNIFLPFYTARIVEKEHPLIADIAEKTLYSNSGYPYFSLSIFEKGIFKGGTIFSVRDEYVSIAYRMYDHVWNNLHTRATPALYAEYLIATHTLSLHKTFLTHGKDRNPYGLNSDIGLAAFKLSVGCYPMLTEEPEITTIDTDTLAVDALILQKPKNGDRITNAFLFTQKATEDRYIQVTKYPDLLNVSIQYRDEWNAK